MTSGGMILACLAALAMLRKDWPLLHLPLYDSPINNLTSELFFTIVVVKTSIKETLGWEPKSVLHSPFHNHTILPLSRNAIIIAQKGKVNIKTLS